MRDRRPPGHDHAHAFTDFHPRDREGLVLASRRNFLKAGLAGMAGLSVPELLRQRAEAAKYGRRTASKKSVILLWMAGGPSHIDTWDPKPGRPVENRGPFGVTATRLPGVQIIEHLPKMAARLDRFTLIRSVDARRSNHEPNTVFQTGNLDAEPRENREARQYPAIASVIAKHHGPNHPAMPPYVAFQRNWSHLAYAGYLGKQYDPFPGNQAARLPVYDNVGKDTGQVSQADMFRLPAELSQERIRDRQSLLKDFDQLRRTLDQSSMMASMDRYSQQAVELLVGGRCQEAF